METPSARPWYKKKRYMISGGLLSLAIVASASESSVPVTPQTNTAAVEQAIVTQQNNVYTQQPAQKAVVQPQASTYTEIPPSNNVAPKPQATTPLSNDNYYTNTAGNEVHSPAYAPSTPSGASAKCRDGTYSFSQSRRGTCSHHGGVAQWL